MTKTTIDQTPATWTHKDHTIMFQPNGEFTVTIKGRIVRSPSLDAAKKKINAALLNSFREFDALSFSFYAGSDTKGIKVHVTGIEKVRGRTWGTTHHFQGKAEEVIHGKPRTREDTFGTLFPDTPECRAAYAAYIELCVVNAARKEEAEKAEAALRAKIPTISADDFAREGRLVIKAVKS